MGQLIVTEFVTLDGVAQAPGAPGEDRDGGFDYDGWQTPLLDEASVDVMFEEASGMEALLLGRRTYEIFAAYWPTAPQEIPFTALLNRVPKYVASRTLAEPLGWAGSSRLSGDLAASVRALKDRHDEVHVIGSLSLVQSPWLSAGNWETKPGSHPLCLASGGSPSSRETTKEPATCWRRASV